jgi:hypothetical protein
MKTSKKVLIGAVVVAVAGVAGYFGYKKYKDTQGVAGLGAFTDGYADYNAHVAAQYWKRQHDLYSERRRIATLRGY